MRRAIFYIDGLNLYHGIIEADLRDVRWLNVQAVSERLLRPGEELMMVRYFNAPAWQKAKRDRQSIYLKALGVHCDKVQIHLGRFMPISLDCWQCKRRITQHEEKETDTAMGAHLVNDLYRRNHDVAYLVTGDSDILGGIDVARSVRSIEIRVAFPPKRGSNDLEKVCDEFRGIKAKHLRPHQLPESVVGPDGSTWSKPPDW